MTHPRQTSSLPAALVAVLALAALVCAVATARAENGPALVVRWIAPSGAELARRAFSLPEIEALDEGSILTRTPWTEGAPRFSGPRLRAVAALGPGEADEARLTALNDYSIAIPDEDWASYDVLLATRVDGAPMRVRDKGPMWVIYPLDDHPELRTQRIHARMIWQVRSIDFVVGAP